MKKLSERNELMKTQKELEGLTNSELAARFGISRERVRQIIGNTGKTFLSNWTLRHLHEYDPSETPLEELPGSSSIWKGVWGKYRHNARSGAIKTGQEFEERASLILKNMGMMNKLMPSSHPFDILMWNNIRIDVKHSVFDISSIGSQKCASPTYRISNLKEGKDCDFFFVFVPIDSSDLDLGYANFIIPSSEISNDAIRVVYPSISRKSSKWTKYLDRYSLLLGDI